MGVRKEHALCSEAVEVGRFYIGMAGQAANPVVQIVDGHKQHVLPPGLLRDWFLSAAGTARQYKCGCSRCRQF